MRRRTFLTISILALALGALRPCRAEFLYFANGGRLQATATIQGDTVLLETPWGQTTFLVQDFVKIAPGGCPEHEWEGRRSAARQKDSSARFAAAWWALENGLIPEAVASLRESRALDPSHPATARLASALDRLDRPVKDPDTGPLRRALGVSLQEARGTHVLLLHQHDDEDARRRLDLLERVVVAYHLLLAGQGIDVEVPDHRLVSVYLKSREDYLAFLNSQNAAAFRTTLGYFHPNFLAVIAYDARSPGESRAEAAVARDPAARDQRRRRLLTTLDALARDHGTAAHEMIHLLVAESRLEPRPGVFPHWLHEGFAAQFEVVRSGRWSGIGRAHDLRLTDFRSLPTAPAPSPTLANLIRDAGFGHGYRRDVYARSWALVYFLRKTRPVEFSAFLDLLRSPQPEDADHFTSAFLAAFGPDLDALETEWKSFMSRIQTPLDESAPSRLPARSVSQRITIDRIGEVAKMLKSRADGA